MAGNVTGVRSDICCVRSNICCVGRNVRRVCSDVVLVDYYRVVEVNQCSVDFSLAGDNGEIADAGQWHFDVGLVVGIVHEACEAYTRAVGDVQIGSD